MTHVIYLAGPLFSLAEREFNRSLAKKLRNWSSDSRTKDYEVFLPQEHPQGQGPAREIFARDKQALENADIVVANMDGPDPDSGTCWECGYACGIGKPVIAFRTDVRPNEEADKVPFNLMLAASATAVIDLRHPKAKELKIEELDELISRIVEKIKALSL
jgi:nucleoside 2-deoxyribosyltransferase